MDNELGLQTLEEIVKQRRANRRGKDRLSRKAVNISTSYVEELKTFEACCDALHRALEEYDGTETDTWEIYEHEERLKTSVCTLSRLMMMWFTEIMNPEQLAKHPLRSR